MKTIFTLALVLIAVTGINAQTKPAVKKTATQKTAVKKTAVKKTVKPATPIAKIPGIRVKVTTDSGVMVIRLYDKTVQHRDNFVKLANEHFFDSLLFHRVIQGFMIQGGDPQSKYAPQGQMLGMGDVGYMVPAEFDPSLYHKKGVLAAARNNNPAKSSSGCQFYIVQGRTWSDVELSSFEMQKGFKYTEAQKKMYRTIGGTPMLDMEYTVFGEVESGMEVIDKIASVAKDQSDRPLGDVRMRIEVMK